MLREVFRTSLISEIVLRLQLQKVEDNLKCYYQQRQVPSQFKSSEFRLLDFPLLFSLSNES